MQPNIIAHFFAPALRSNATKVAVVLRAFSMSSALVYIDGGCDSWRRGMRGVCNFGIDNVEEAVAAAAAAAARVLVPSPPPTLNSKNLVADWRGVSPELQGSARVVNRSTCKN